MHITHHWTVISTSRFCMWYIDMYTLYITTYCMCLKATFYIHIQHILLYNFQKLHIYIYASAFSFLLTYNSCMFGHVQVSFCCAAVSVCILVNTGNCASTLRVKFSVHANML